MEFADLKKSIINLDDSVLSLEELLSLKSFIPTPEEINLLNEYKGDIKLLDKPEQFFLEVIFFFYSFVLIIVNYYSFFFKIIRLNLFLIYLNEWKIGIL